MWHVMVVNIYFIINLIRSIIIIVLFDCLFSLAETYVTCRPMKIDDRRALYNKWFCENNIDLGLIPRSILFSRVHKTMYQPHAKSIIVYCIVGTTCYRINIYVLYLILILHIVSFGRHVIVFINLLDLLWPTSSVTIWSCYSFTADNL